jgi:hypothetical protein
MIPLLLAHQRRLPADWAYRQNGRPSETRNSKQTILPDPSACRRQPFRPAAIQNNLGSAARPIPVQSPNEPISMARPSKSLALLPNAIASLSLFSPCAHALHLVKLQSRSTRRNCTCERSSGGPKDYAPSTMRKSRSAPDPSACSAFL